MKLTFLALGMLIIFAGAASAASLDLNPANSSVSIVNTKTWVLVYNVSLNVSGGPNILVNISSINITVINGSSANISDIQLYNLTNHLVASNSTFNATTNTTRLSFSALTVNSTYNYSLAVYANISSNATAGSRIAFNITETLTTASEDIITNNTFGGSSFILVQSVHANATMSPRFVDTRVVNQTFQYSLNVTGTNGINNITINAPVGYIIANVTLMTLNGADLIGAGSVTISRNTTVINMTKIGTPFATNDKIIINFTANTSSSDVSTSRFTSFLYGSNLSSVETNYTEGETNVTTKQIVNITSVKIVKGAAILNGTDYWEFNFTINFSANVTGLLQFNMTNWTNSAGQNLSLVNSTYNLTTLRDNQNTSRYINITNSYGAPAEGISITDCCTTGTYYYVVLRMIIPLNTPISNNWAATYGALFRSTP